jgi:hypothetical protein
MTDRDPVEVRKAVQQKQILSTRIERALDSG